ncbi:DUF4209 domain-containing protein [Luteipulveratus flavus]|uniref:DUF4209 domain-containing protein n=1 Tax=Luteipulveratus flavus TaxID=3031728 RepID=A0ABT6C8U3_9MICO|nr:DUF4209 domain-containing protein [Luteipulveratus sp. YIM 133296]MDF8265210.1 DUF4209 domain-containing protein [Luteipulveratus sp. YIM 133296]
MDDTSNDGADDATNDDAAKVLSQDTTYVFDAGEARVLVPLIDKSFQLSDGVGGSRDYHGAHSAFRTSIATLLGTTVSDLDLRGAKKEIAAAASDVSSADGPVEQAAEKPAVDPVVGEPMAAESTEEESPGASAAVGGGAQPVGEPIRHELDRAFMYEFVVAFDGPVTCTLGHYDKDSEFVWPPRIENVTDAVAELWEFMAWEASAPAAVARFHDLMFIRGRNKFTHAVAARDAYLEFAALAPVVDLDQAHAMLRAWAIDRIFGRTAELGATRLAIEQAITAAWDAGRGYPGVVLPLLNAVCQTQRPAATDPVKVDALLEHASRLYEGTDSIGYVAELRRGRATTDAERIVVDEWHVEQLAAAARTSDGFVKAMRLRDAIREAGRLQLRGLEEKLTVELQSLPPEDAKMEVFTSDLVMSRVPIERFLRQFTRSQDWRRSMGLFSQIPPPTGSSEDLERAAETRRLRPRLVDLFSTVLLDEDRLPSWEPTTEEERREYQKARDAGFSAAASATQLTEILDRFKIRYGAVPVDEIATYVSHQGRGNYELAAVFARALHHYWNRDLEACIHIAVPRIESAVRLILRELDVAIYRVQLGKRPGQYPPLGSLLGELLDLGFDEAWIYYLRWLLTEHTGKNLRNEVAHGRVRGVSEANAVLVLRALLLVVLLCGPGNADDIDADLPERGDGGAKGGEQPAERAEKQSGDRPTSAPPAGSLRTLIRQPVPKAVELPARSLVVARRLVQAAWPWFSRST